MPNPKTLSVPVAPGIREDLSPHMAPPGTLTNAQNVRFPVAGEAESRRGTTALSATSGADVDYSDILSGVGMVGQLPGGFAVGSQGYGFRFDFAKSRMHTGGSYANAEPLGIFDVIAREQVAVSFANNNAVPWPLSQVVFGGYVATVHSCGNGQEIVSVGESYEVGPGDNVCILRVFTEAGVLVTSAILSNISAAFLVADGANAALVMQDTTTGLTARTLTPSASGVTLSAETSVGTLTSATSYWHACTWSGQGWALIYQSGAAVVTIKKMTGVTTSATQTFAVTGTVPVSVYCDATNLYAGWREGAAAPVDANARVYDATLTLVSGGSVTLATDAAGLYVGPPLFGPCTTAASAMWAVSRGTTPAISDASRLYWGELSAAGAAVSGTTIYQCSALSAPFGNGYCWVRMGNVKDSFSNRYERAALLDFMGMRTSAASATSRAFSPVVALTGVPLAGAEGSAYPGAWYLQGLGVPSQLSDGSYVMAIPRTVRLETVPSGGLGGLTIGEWLRFSVGGTRQTSPVRKTLAVAGFPTLAVPSFGTVNYATPLVTTNIQRSGCDLGCPVPPGIDTPTSSNSTGSLTSGGAYQWRAVAEYIDGDGVRWRSAPSVVVNKTLGASDDTAALTARFNPNFLRNNSSNTFFQWVVHFYRTVAGGSTFFRCTPPQGAPVNTTGTGIYTFTDELSDGSLQAREILYTDGGVLGNDAPSSCRFIACTEDRLWLGGLWETDQLQSSKVLVPGEPPQFSDLDSFRVVLPAPCTGIAVQDGALIAFCKSAIYVIQGEGPNDQGQGAWGSPRVITRSTGCVNSRSILETSAGVFFQSLRGIELLPRGLGEPQFIGAPVQDSLTGNVLSASVTSADNCRTARFVIGGTADAATATVLVFDLDTGAWSRDVYPLNVAAICETDNGAVLALAAISSTYGFLLEDNDVATDNTGNAASAVASTLQWAAIRPYGVAGQGRFGGAVAMFDELVSLASPGFQTADATLFMTVDRAADPGKAYDMGVMASPDYRKHVPLQEAGSACVLKVTMAANGWRFMGWTLEVDDMGGPRRMGETEQG